MFVEIIITLLLVLGIIIALLFLLKKPIEGYFKLLGQDIAEKSARAAEERVKGRELVLEEKIRSGDKSLHESKQSIKDLVNTIAKELTQHQQKLEVTERERTSMFSALKTEVERNSKVTEGLKGSTDDLKNILSNNQLRGKYGEEVAENLLKAAGFVKGQNYVLNTAQSTAQSRPDVTIFLPDKTKIQIDAKFPLSALVKYQETEDAGEKERFLKMFTQDVKAKIKEVSTRDYINPEEGTVDFVILFVPNEMIFSFIHDHLHEVWGDALQKKVILAGPFSFTAILRMIYQSYKNFTYQENMHNIIKLVKTFEQEWVKYNESVEGLGKSLDTLNNKYRLVATTRTNKLGGIVDKIKGQDVLPNGADVEKISDIAKE